MFGVAFRGVDVDAGPLDVEKLRRAEPPKPRDTFRRICGGPSVTTMKVVGIGFEETSSAVFLIPKDVVLTKGDAWAGGSSEPLGHA